MPPERLTVTEFAEKYIVLDSTSPEPGQYRVSRTPWVKGWLDTFNDPEIETVVIQCASQVAKTTTELLIAAYVISERPAPTMIVFPTVEVAEDYSRTRLDPLIENHSNLNRKRRDDRHLFTTLRKQFLGMDLYITGANSASSLQSKPIAVLLFDEVSTMPEILTGLEVSPVDSALERTKAFSLSRKIYMVSTPSHQYGRITTELQDCDRVNLFALPCPRCGAFQVLTFSQVKWPEVSKDDPNRLKIIEAETRYECERCKAALTDTDKLEMLKHGEWRTDSLSDRRKKIGFQLSSLYSPWVKFGEMAVKFLKSKDNTAALRNFINSWLGEPYIQGSAGIKSERVFALRDNRHRGVVPPQVVALTAGVDVQQDHFFYVIRGWADDLSSWLIREGVIDTFEALESILFNSSYSVSETSEKREVNLACVDSGFRTDEVYEWVRRYPARSRAVKGATHQLKSPYQPSRIDYNYKGKQLRGGLMIWLLDSGYWKDALFRRLQMNPEDPGSWRVHSEISREYAEHLVSEHRVIHRNRKTGRVTEEWQKVTTHAANHYLDAEYMALAAAEMLGVRNIEKPSRQQDSQARTVPGRQAMKSRWMQATEYR